MCCGGGGGGGWGGRDRRGMRDREEQVNSDIYISAPQDEASYDNALK